MTTRMNEHLRTAIVANALAKAGIPQEYAALDAKYRDWTEETRVFVNGATDAELKKIDDKIQALFTTLPQNVRGSDRLQVFDRHVLVRINLAGAAIQLNFTNEAGEPENRIRTRVHRPVVPAGHPLVERFYALEGEKKALDERSGTLKAQVGALLKRVTTTKRLLEVWPEAKELLPDDLTEASVNLPALAISDLNAAIGLPTEE